MVVSITNGAGGVVAGDVALVCATLAVVVLVVVLVVLVVFARVPVVLVVILFLQVWSCSQLYQINLNRMHTTCMVLTT